MNYKLFFFASAVLLFSCASEPPYQAQIDALEHRLAAQYTPERSDTLVNLYREAVKSHPEDHATNLRYLTRASEVQFDLRKDGVSAARWIADALVHHAKGQDLTETIGLLMRIWNGYQYKTAATVRMDPKDIDGTRDRLLAHIVWADSALVRLDAAISKTPTAPDRQKAAQFIEISEAYASLAQSPDQWVNLLSKAAALAKTVENFNKSIQLYAKICDKLPNHPSAPQALFLQGFIYENDLGDIEKARATYERFLQDYPNDPDYADDAQMALKTLGKSPEELIKMFEKNAQQQ